MPLTPGTGLYAGSSRFAESDNYTVKSMPHIFSRCNAFFDCSLNTLVAKSNCDDTGLPQAPFVGFNIEEEK